MPKFAVILFTFAASATSVFASPIDLARACAAATANGGWGLSDEVSCLKESLQPEPSSTNSGSLALDGDLAEDGPLGGYVALLARLRREAWFDSDQIGTTAIPPALSVVGQVAFVTDAATWTDSTTAPANMVTNPEPASLILLGSGIAAGIARRGMLRTRNRDGVWTT